MIRQGYVSVGGDNSYFLTPAHNWIHDWIRDWHPELDPKVGSILEYEYSVTRGAMRRPVIAHM